VRLTFSRMADRRPVETLVERDDGVVFAMRGAGGGAELPHDLVHAVVEEALGIPDGIWGCVADGAVWGSMRHVSGRRPPHWQERSDRLKKERTAAIARAEAVADLASRLARGAEVLPGQGAGSIAGSGFPPARIDQAVDAVRSAERRWAQLSPGATWTVTWAARPARARRSRAG